MREGVHDYQSGNADGCGGGKQSRQQTGLFPRHCGKG